MAEPDSPRPWRALWTDEALLEPPDVHAREGRVPRSRTSRRGRGVLGLAVVGLLVAGVLAAVAGTPPEDAGPPNLIAHAVDLAEEAGSARVSLSVAVESPGPIPEELQGSFGGEGVMDLVDGEVQMTVTIAGPGIAEPEEIEFRMIGTTMYMRAPFFTEASGFETDWFSVDMSELAGLGTDELLGTEMGPNDPSQQLEFLRGASDEIDELGREDVRGVSTTRYRAVVDAADAVDEVPEEEREFLRKSLELMEEDMGTTEFPLDAWVDDDGLPRRVRFTFGTPATAGAPEGTAMAMTMEFYDFGIEVDVEPPPPDETVDLTEVLKQGYGLDR